jgi:phenylpropionate dioxygenase-like ring-hydroxylating dioxygenase large terminal subunit
MLSTEQNELVTRIGPGTPCGELMRRYWQPAALSEELTGKRPVKPVRLLGESLVLFKNPDGSYGLVGRHCPHRGADLAFGRLEGGGLRCAFHGWLFDAQGRCLEQPAEPEDSRFHTQIRHAAYPCVEKNGVVFTYMGPGAPPAFPEFDCFVAPEPYTFAFKGFMEANWLQALEVGIDPAHASFLHRFFDDGDPAAFYGQQFRDTTAGADIPLTQLMRNFDRPRIEVEDTDYGLRIAALRELDATRLHVRVTNHVFPHAIVIPITNDMLITQWHVPVDDAHSYWYAIFSDFRTVVDKETMRAQRLQLYTLPDYVPRLNRANNWGFDPDEQQSRTYTGMGEDINVHDQWAVEGPGAIYDRTTEHLGTTDKAIAAYRRKLLSAIADVERGATPPFILNADSARRFTGPAAFDVVGPRDGWDANWRRHERARRAASPWAAKLADAAE